MSKRVLWITDESPDKDLGGGSIRQYHMLRRLAKHATVDLLVAGPLRDQELRNSLGQVIELSHPPPVQPNLRSWVASHQAFLPGGIPSDLLGSRRLLEVFARHLGQIDEYDLVQVEHEQLASLIDRPHSNKWIVTFHNLLSVRLTQMEKVIGTRRGRWLAARDARYALRFERAMVDSYDTVIVMSDEDAEILSGDSLVVPNGVDLHQFRPTPLPPQPRILLSASFNWFPNIEGAQWFCSEVLPLIRAKVADATLLLVGRQPDYRVRNLEHLQGVEAHFDVPSLVPYLTECRIVLVPLRIGSGTRLKALEGMASARPLAGTTIGLDGLGLRDGISAAIADDPSDLAERIIELCQSDESANRLAAVAYDIATSRYDWERLAGMYVDHVSGLIGLDIPGPSANIPG